MPRLILLVPLVVALGACSQSREVYQQTRTVPTSTVDAYGAVAQLGWSGPPQVYELPTTSPVVDGEGPERISCKRPGPQFKATTMVAWSHGPKSSARMSDVQPLVGISLQRPEGDDTSMKNPDVVGMDSRPYRPGMSLDRTDPAIGASNLRPRSITGMGTDVRPPQRMLGLNERTNPYCDRDDNYGTLQAEALSPGEQQDR